MPDPAFFLGRLAKLEEDMATLRRRIAALEPPADAEPDGPCRECPHRDRRPEARTETAE